MEPFDMDWDNAMRRVDLNLRSVYFDLETTIYKIADAPYQIFIAVQGSEFAAIAYQFDREIKPISYPVRLVNTAPDVYEKLIDAIPDENIAQALAGIDYTVFDILHLLHYKFPQIHFYKINSTPTKSIVHIYLLEQATPMGKSFPLLGQTERSAILDFLAGLKLPYIFELIEDQVTQAPAIELPHIINPVFNLFTDSLMTRPVSEFVQRDEALWFDHVDAIYTGEFTKADLAFIDAGKYACYADLSVFENIDIRNFLFLYQTVYLSLPIEKDLRDWLKGQRIKEEEFAELIKRDRIKLVLVQPEYRYRDSGFFQVLYKINPNAIITRRALATLQQIDLVEMADNYIFNDASILSELKVFCEGVGSKLSLNGKQYYDLLTWPLKAKRSSFSSLNLGGVLTMGALGVNKVLDKVVSDRIGKDVSFEFTMNGANIHPSHALNATYFPYFDPKGYSDAFYANITGDFLNFFRRATPENIVTLNTPSGQSQQHIPMINPIEVIEVNNYMPILEMDDVLTAANAFPKSQYLISYLASLDLGSRATRIDWYNKKVKEVTEKKQKRSKWINLGLNAGLDTVGLVSGAAFLGLGFEAIRSGYKLSQSFKDFRAIKAKIDAAYEDDLHGSNISYLAEINRVAGVKRF